MACRLGNKRHKRTKKQTRTSFGMQHESTYFRRELLGKLPYRVPTQYPIDIGKHNSATVLTVPKRTSSHVSSSMHKSRVMISRQHWP